MNSNDKIKTREEAIRLVENWRSLGQSIVFTNGCFDIIHPGHVEYLEKARSLGDKLVIGLNTDLSVTRLKGAHRPVIDLRGRQRILGALACVDLVVAFDEDTPYDLIQSLTPDILVKGSDYLAENIVGADIVVKKGGKVLTVELVEGYSTTGLINRIKNL